MKTIKQLLKQEPVYLNDFDGKFSVIANFEDVYITESEYNSEKSPVPNEEYWLEKKTIMNALIPQYKDINILFASYGYQNYSGEAWVLFEKGGELFEVNASHCSCYGLEGQFDPEPVVLEELKNRLEKGTFGEDSYSGNEFKNELIKFLGICTK